MVTLVLGEVAVEGAPGGQEQRWQQQQQEDDEHGTQHPGTAVLVSSQ